MPLPTLIRLCRAALRDKALAGTPLPGSLIRRLHDEIAAAVRKHGYPDAMRATRVLWRMTAQYPVPNQASLPLLSAFSDRATRGMEDTSREAVCEILCRWGLSPRQARMNTIDMGRVHVPRDPETEK